MDQPLSDQEKKDIRGILSHFYGDQTQTWHITIKTFETLGELIKKTRACDSMMDLVPRPFRGGSIIRWGQKRVRQFVLKKLKGNEGKHYIVCMRAAAVSMKTDFYMSGF